MNKCNRRKEKNIKATIKKTCSVNILELAKAGFLSVLSFQFFDGARWATSNLDHSYIIKYIT